MSRMLRSPLLYLVLVLAACERASSPAPTEPPLLEQSAKGCNSDTVYAIIDQIFPTGTPRKQVRGQFTAMLSHLQSGDTTTARQKMNNVISLTLARWEAGTMVDPNGSADPTIGNRIAVMFNELYKCIGDGAQHFSAATFDGNGTAKLIDGSGGDLVIDVSGVRVPPGAVQGLHLFTLTRHDELARGGTTASGIGIQSDGGSHCLGPNAGVEQVGFCVDASVAPDTRFAKPITLVICTLRPGEPYGPEDQAQHDRLRNASRDHHDPSKIVIYDRVADPFPLDCSEASLAAAARSLVGERLYASRPWRAIARALARMTAPLRPATLFAADGLGSEHELTTLYTAVDPITLSEGFESESGWTTSGLWHRSTMAADSNTAYPLFVTLGEGDASEGRLPGAAEGEWAFWFGSHTTGNYADPPGLVQVPFGGGASAAPQTGALVSPAIIVVNSTNDLTMRYRAWFEIESVRPSTHDQMVVEVENVATGARTRVDRLNPATNPPGNVIDLGGARIHENAPRPFTSGGFNVAPAWIERTVSLNPFRGQTVRLRFSFGSGDTEYNGFRGWIVDDVVLRVGSEPAS